MNNLENTVVLSDKDMSEEKTIILNAIEKVGAVTGKDLSSIEIEDTREALSDVQEHFELYDRFAEGGQGYISRAKDIALKRSVAVKSLKKQKGSGETSERLFCDEALLTAQLDHPSIIPIYSLNTDDKKGLHFSMKLVKGVTLQAYFKETLLRYRVNGLKGVEEKIAQRNRLEIFLKICDAMAFAHSRGVIHRDLKPENIMIGEFNEVYVMDWGIAIFDETRSANESLEAANLGLCGTPGYIAPSLINGGRPNKQSDIYSLGMILHEVATLEKGFMGETAEERFTHAKTGNLRPVHHVYSHVKIPADLSAIIEKARAVDPSHSYEDVRAFADDIRRYLINEEVKARPDNALRKTYRWLQHHSKQTIIAACLLLLLLASLNIYSLTEQVNLEKKAQARQEKLASYQSVVSKKAHKIDSYISNFEHLLLDTAARLQSGERGSTALGSVIYSSNDFSHEETRPVDTAFSKVFGKEVSVASPGYKLAPGQTLSSTKGFLNYLYTFTKDFQKIILRSEITASRKLYNESLMGNIIANRSMPVKWVYGGFNNGVFISYPGKGGYPEDYDHRKRPWYKEAIDKDGLNWGEPYYDVNGLGLVLPCTYTIRGGDSSKDGVFALDVTLDFIIEDLMKEKGETALIEAVIMSNDGKVILSTEYEDLNKKSQKLSDKTVASEFYSNNEVLSALQLGKKQLILKENGREIVYEISEIPALNWYYLEKKALADL